MVRLGIDDPHPARGDGEVVDVGLGGPAVRTAQRPVMHDHDVLFGKLVERHGDGALTRGTLRPHLGARRLAAQRQDQAAERGMRGADALLAAPGASVVGTLGRRASNVPLVRDPCIDRQGSGGR